MPTSCACAGARGRASAEGELQIVCGAPNARVGLRAPLALVGAVLPPAATATRCRSAWASCAASKAAACCVRRASCKLSDDHGGLLELPADAPLGADVRELLNLDDTVFTLKLTPNLGHALSVYGVAREVSALTGAPLRTPAIAAIAAGARSARADRDRCQRPVRPLFGRVVRGVNPRAKTPQWIVDRLARCGQRRVNALVDISNYVMFEYGRPSHIFDLDKIHGGLEVRWGATRRDAETAQRQHHRGRRTGRRDRRCGRRRVAGRHHGR